MEFPDQKPDGPFILNESESREFCECLIAIFNFPLVGDTPVPLAFDLPIPQKDQERANNASELMEGHETLMQHLLIPEPVKQNGLLGVDYSPRGY